MESNTRARQHSTDTIEAREIVIVIAHCFLRNFQEGRCVFVRTLGKPPHLPDVSVNLFVMGFGILPQMRDMRRLGGSIYLSMRPMRGQASVKRKRRIAL